MPNSFWGAFWSNAGLADWVVDCPKLGTAVSNRSPASRKWISRTRAVRKYFRIDFPITVLQQCCSNGKWNWILHFQVLRLFSAARRFRSRELHFSTVLQPLNWTKSVVRRRRSIWLVDFDLSQSWPDCVCVCAQAGPLETKIVVCPGLRQSSIEVEGRKNGSIP